MMYCRIICIVLLLGFGSIRAQNSKETKLLDRMTKEACEALGKTEFSKDEDVTSLQMKLGLALLPVLSKHEKEIKEVWNLDVSSSGDQELLGRKLGANMVYKCDHFQKLIDLINAADKTAEEKQAPQQASSEITALQATGQLDHIEGTDVNYVFLKTDDGETMRFLWLEKCPGSELLETYFADGKSILCRFTYRVSAIYQAKTKSYQPVKIITRVEGL